MKRICILVLLLIFTFGCYDIPCKNSEMPKGELKQANGFNYVLVEIESKKFIAYQTSFEYWELCGPVN